MLNKDLSVFRRDLQNLINRHGLENVSNTPDFMLAEYLCRCLICFDIAVNEREQWYGRKKDNPRLVIRGYN